MKHITLSGLYASGYGMKGKTFEAMSKLPSGAAQPEGRWVPCLYKGPAEAKVVTDEGLLSGELPSFTQGTTSHSGHICPLIILTLKLDF